MKLMGNPAADCLLLEWYFCSVLFCLADLILYTNCLFVHHFIFQDVVAGFQLLSTQKLQRAETVSCRSLLCCLRWRMHLEFFEKI